MTREQYRALSRKKARKVLSRRNFRELIDAIKTKGLISFLYTNKENIKKKYKEIRPKEFFYTPGWSKPPKEGAVYLWGKHLLHRRNHSFRADRIKRVKYMPSFIEALTDPQKHRAFWAGASAI